MLKNPRKPFLQITDGQVTGPYVALSYCWGDSRHLQTIKATFLTFQKLIPTKCMPKTFKDAIFVTYNLGIQYLWIDNLCIIQDDPVDLCENINHMGSIYRDAIFSIFAAAAPNADRGLFVNRDSRWYQPCPLEISVTAEDGRSGGKLFAISTSYPSRSSPLYKRGWVLQEEVLSSRNLIFGPRMLSWKCSMSHADEAHPWFLTPSNIIIDHNIALRQWLFVPDSIKSRKRSTTHRRNQFDAWYTMVEDFSARELTFTSDTLPALAGLANLFATSYRCTYVAGLWKEDLQVGLAWYVVEGCSVSSSAHQQNPNSPSWSWSSVQTGSVCFQGWEANHQNMSFAGAEVLDTHCSSAWSSSKLSMLRLSAPIKQAVVRYNYQYYQDLEFGRSSENYIGSFEKWTVKPMFPGVLYDMETNKAVGEASIDSPIATKKLSPNEGELYTSIPPETLDLEVNCLLLLVRKKHHQWQLTCLLLSPTHRIPNEYRRVGIGLIHTSDWFGNLSYFYAQQLLWHGECLRGVGDWRPEPPPEWSAALGSATII